MDANPFTSRHVVVGVTGGIAAYKAAELVSRLRQRGADVTVVMTRAATRFVRPLTFAALTGKRVITDLFDPPDRYQADHVALAQEADLAIVAPATANFIGKAAAGIADDALTTTILSLQCPIVVAPAMNHRMWANPVVQQNLRRLRERGFHIVEPQEGWLACGEVGVGRLAEVSAILEAAAATLSPPQT